jgi:tRNA-Thr(GGU) m(6)t(6)A37 methyltransferase TsaA
LTHKSARWDGGPICMTPIGVLRSPFVERVDAPRQPKAAEDIEGRVELFPGCRYEDALSDLDRFDHLWLVVWFDRNLGYRPKVLPPRSEVKRGVFATRAPYRPNPIGLSAVRLLRIEGLTIFVRGLDLLDGTPVLDVKPYVPYSDAIPEANHGWLDAAPVAGTRPQDPLADYEVQFGELAGEQLAYLQREHAIDLREKIETALRLGPTPHAYRRIRREGDTYLLALKDLRVRFACDARVIRVLALNTGYRPKELFSPEGGAPPAHRAFVAKWGRLQA